MYCCGAKRSQQLHPWLNKPEVRKSEATPERCHGAYVYALPFDPVPDTRPKPLPPTTILPAVTPEVSLFRFSRHSSCLRLPSGFSTSPDFHLFSRLADTVSPSRACSSMASALFMTVGGAPRAYPASEARAGDTAMGSVARTAWDGCSTDRVGRISWVRKEEAGRPDGWVHPREFGSVGASHGRPDDSSRSSESTASHAAAHAADSAPRTPHRGEC